MRIKKFSLSPAAQIFKSFSDESRIRIIFLLYHNKEMCISDLEQVLNFTQTKTSRHLAYLKNAGIVKTRKHDQWVFYFIKDELHEIITQVIKFINSDHTLLKDLETFKVLYSNRELSINRIESKKWSGY